MKSDFRCFSFSVKLEKKFWLTFMVITTHNSPELTFKIYSESQSEYNESYWIMSCGFCYAILIWLVNMIFFFEKGKDTPQNKMYAYFTRDDSQDHSWISYHCMILVRHKPKVERSIKKILWCFYDISWKEKKVCREQRAHTNKSAKPWNEETT